MRDPCSIMKGVGHPILYAWDEQGLFSEPDHMRDAWKISRVPAPCCHNPCIEKLKDSPHKSHLVAILWFSDALSCRSTPWKSSHRSHWSSCPWRHLISSENPPLWFWIFIWSIFINVVYQVPIKLWKRKRGLAIKSWTAFKKESGISTVLVWT